MRHFAKKSSAPKGKWSNLYALDVVHVRKYTINLPVYGIQFVAKLIRQAAAIDVSCHKLNDDDDDDDVNNWHEHCSHADVLGINVWALLL